MTIRGVHVETAGLYHRYGARKGFAFEHVTMEAQPGEAVAIIGRSGCGKSTVLQVIAGLLHPAGGSVRINGLPVVKPSPRWILLFQAPHLYPWMKVSQNVGIGLHFAGRPKDEIRGRVAKVLRLVDLEAFSESNVQDLSGGQQQRVALARSLVMEPELLLLDEPFSALDAFTQGALQRDVRSIVKNLGITLILVTHDIDEAVLMADRVLIMAGSPGTIVHSIPIELGSTRERDDPSALAIRRRVMEMFEAAEAARATRPVPQESEVVLAGAKAGT
ncbi:MAG TPA: ABC transporter ATP-binding protein [Burkholderiales bacterium]|nr:ABC transporter ATP-binding protein [Burkholderiales bacterium]